MRFDEINTLIDVNVMSASMKDQYFGDVDLKLAHRWLTAWCRKAAHPLTPLPGISLIVRTAKTRVSATGTTVDSRYYGFEVAITTYHEGTIDIACSSTTASGIWTYHTVCYVRFPAALLALGPHPELQNESPEAPELQQLRQQQLAELDALLVAGASPEHREKLGSEAAQQRELQHKLAKKREELALLETSLHLAGAKDDEPVKADLREDLAAFGSDELQQAVEKLPGSTSILQHLLMAHPSWKQRFYQIGGLEKILEKMERTKKVFYHQRLAQCLCRTLDMDRVSARPDPDKNIARLVQQVLDITNGARFPLDSNSDEARILEYMELMEAIAQDKVARRLLVQGGAVAVALQFTQHRAQAVAAAALNALGQVASDSESEIHIPAEALRFALSILQSGQSARMKKAAAQCLQRLCYGSTPSAQELRRSLEALRAVPELLEAARHFQSAERQVGRNDGAEVARHVKNAALLMLNDRDKITPDPSHRRIVLEAMADATAKSFAKEVAFNNVAAGIQCFGHVKLGAWTARPITAGGPLQCSTSWMNPMYALRFQTAQKKVALAVSVVDPDAEARREQGASQQQRSLYHVSRIVTVKGSQSAQGEEKDQATFLEDLIARGLNSPLFWQGSQSSAPFMSEDVTAQHLDEMDTEDSHILMLSMGTALQEKRYVISVCADAEMELMPLSTEGWQRRSFLGHWQGEVPRSAQSMIRLQQSFPQLIITNASTSTASVCLVLSYSKKDTQHMKKHSWHEEDDEDNIDPSCPDESYPLLDVQLFDNGRHPIHRYMGGGSAVAKNRKASNEWVALGAKLPPCSTHNLVMSRCWAQAQEQVADNKAYQSFRLLVLSDCNELEMQPARCSNEWRVKSTTLQRVQETTATTLNLKLKEASGSQPLPQPLHLLVTTCADDKSPAYMMLQVHPASAKEEVDPAVCPRKDGKRVFLSHSAHYEYELSGSNGSDWTIKINYHPQCKPGFLVGMHVFSLCDVDIQWQKPSGKVDATSEAERAFVDEFYTKLPSWHDPHTEEDLQIEDSVFPPVPTQRPEDKEMVSVSVAYLQRLHRRALRDQRGQEE
ncbi:unnamed protein product [Effrenium voratum]|nr:unnamed protein product [Effrenium voratum]